MGRHSLSAYSPKLFQSPPAVPFSPPPFLPATSSATTRTAAVVAALVVHGLAAVALVALPATREWIELSVPVRVSLLPATLPSKAADLPRPAVSSRPRPQPAARPVHPTQPVAPPPVPALPPFQQEAVPPALLAMTAASDTTFLVAPPPPVPAPRQDAGVGTAPAPPGPASAAPAPLVEAHLDANYQDNPKPAYPDLSRRLGERGTVRLRVHVGADGRTLEVAVQASSGHARLDESAAAAVSRWRFVPARRGALAVASWVIVPITYSID